MGQAAGCPGQRALSQEGPGGASWGSVLLLVLSRCDCGELVLDPEALHKEAQDGAVQVLLEGGAAEVVALVRVDLKGAEDSATWPPPPCGPGARETRGPPAAHAAGPLAPTAQGVLRVSGKESDDTLFSRLCTSGSACSDPQRIQAQGPQRPWPGLQGSGLPENWGEPRLCDPSECRKLPARQVQGLSWTSVSRGVQWRQASSSNITH